jgi:DNA-binding IclR family transcriptional regulator
MAVLKGLAYLGGRSNLKALADHVGQSPAKAHRYLASLIDEGLVAQDAVSQQYYLGAEAIQIGIAAMRQADPVRAVDLALVRLRETHGITCFVAVMGNHGPTIVRMEEPGLPVTINVRVGSVLPLMWSATGRVFLGLLDDTRVREMAQAELNQAAALRRPALRSRDPIGQLCREVRKHGMATVRDAYLPGISAVAAPVYDHSGRVCSVLTALGASGGFDPDLEAPVARSLRLEAAAASARLGYAARPDSAQE